MHSPLSSLERKIQAKNTFEFYFKPRGFEKIFYEKIGMKQFHSLYSATVGKVVLYTAGIDRWLADSFDTSLIKQEKWSRYYESIHVVAGLVMTSLMTYSYAEENYSNALFSASSNVLINILPVLMQRYTRSRIYEILKRRSYSN